MPISRSSIFSFETLSLKDGSPRGPLGVVAFVLLLLLGAELLSRVITAPYEKSWPYWHPGAANKFEGYRSLASQNKTPSIVIVGDSTAARNLDPKLIQEALPSGSAFNLAWPSNFIGAFPCTTLPLLSEPLSAPRVVLVSLSPLGFYDNPTSKRLEANITSSAYCRMMADEFELAQYLALARYSHLSVALLRGNEEGQPDGFMPLAPKEKSPAKSPRERRSDTPQTSPSLNIKKAEILEALAALSTNRGARLVILIPPNQRQQRQPPKDFTDFVLALCEKYNADLLDYSAADFLQDEDFYDAGHLNQNGAKRFSGRVSQDLQKLLSTD